MTDLFGPVRVAKDDARIEALGALDEAQSAVGVARARASDEAMRALLRRIEARLSVAMAEVAAVDVARLKDRISAGDVADLEAALACAPPFAGFSLPGETVLGAALHMARTVVRRAERRVVTLGRLHPMVGSHLPAYLNRLSSVLYALAASVAA
jgi:cob(I)alamin adenosyltransferase